MNLCRICCVGDSCGKSTLILALIKDSFVDNVQQKVPQVTIPPESTAGSITTIITDTCLADQQDLINQLSECDVVCLCYETISNIASFWIPFISTHSKSPIVLCRTKSDVTLEIDVSDFFLNPQVQASVECSAKLGVNVSDCFYLCQKVAIYPSSILYDKELTILCKNALIRIFAISDKNRDEVLDHMEINWLQTKCFRIPLQKHEIDELLETVSARNFMTESEFLEMHKQFIERGRAEATWTVLRCFGYQNDLSLKLDFCFEEDKNCVVELQRSCISYLVDLFSCCDKDKNGALSNYQLDFLFKTCPAIPKWFPKSSTCTKQGLTLKGFLSLWSMMAHIDPKQTLRCLGYMGYEDYPLKSINFHEKKQRKTFLCQVYGDAKSGKSEILQSFVLTKEKTVCNQVDINGLEICLILKDSNVLGNCDVACLVYDSSNPASFAFIAKIIKKLSNIPVVVVSTNSVSQKEISFCKKQGIEHVLCIKKENMNDLFQLIAAVSMNPELAQKKSSALKFIAIASSVVIISVAAFKMWKYLKN